MDNPSIDDFSGWLNQRCEIAAGDARVPATLVAAEPLAGSPREKGGFRLEFLGPVDPMLGQGVMAVAGPTASCDIFLVPIARDAGGTRYEAVFF